ncbi:33921_t:CDS:2, partial [Racocetra persica]
EFFIGKLWKFSGAPASSQKHWLTSRQRPGSISSKLKVHWSNSSIGGMVGATVTSPLDVMKTRLQSSLYNPQSKSSQPFIRSTTPILGHFIDTGRLLTYVYRNEGWRALFKGLGPNLVGVVPA